MAAKRATEISIDISYDPFPVSAGDSVTIFLTTLLYLDSRPDARPVVEDIRAVVTSAGHPLVPDLIALQDRASTFIESRFMARGEDLTTSPLQNLTFSWSFTPPLQAGFSNLAVQMIGRWAPVGGPQHLSTESVTVLLNDGQIPETANILNITSAAVGQLDAQVQAAGDTLLLGPFGG